MQITKKKVLLDEITDSCVPHKVWMLGHHQKWNAHTLELLLLL